MHSRLRSRRKFTDGDSRSGRLAVVTCSIKKSLKNMVQTDRRTTVRTIANELGVSCPPVNGILTEELRMSKVSARWISRLLREKEMERRVHCSQTFLHCYESEGEDFSRPDHHDG